MPEIQSFEASEVDTYHCEQCNYCGRGWNAGKPIYHNEEISAWHTSCPVCNAPATMFND